MLFVMGFLFLFVTDVTYYGLRKMLDVLSSVMMRLGHRVADRWLGDIVVAPRSVVASGGDAGVLPRSGRCNGAVVGGRGSACVHCLVDIEPQVYSESSLVTD